MPTPDTVMYDRRPLDEFKSSIQSNFGDATKYKFSQDVIANLKELIDLFNEIGEPNGLNYVKALILKICGATGEYIDLLAQPYTNSFGYKHNTNSGLDGINCTINKIIDELVSIGATTVDAKTDKRANRLKFLKMCKKVIITPIASGKQPIEALFTIMCNYLNGGGVEGENPSLRFTGDSQYDSYIVLTASGGNLVTIFARLLEYLLDRIDSKRVPNPHFDAILYALTAKYGEPILQQLIDKIKTINTTDATEDTNLEDLIRELANYPLSDIDLKLAPYWKGIRLKSVRQGRGEGIQFLLARLKIANNCKDIKFKKLKNPGQSPELHRDDLKDLRRTLEADYKEICTTLPDSTEIAEEIEDLYPSRMKEKYLKYINDAITKENSKSSPDPELLTKMKKCKIFLLSLSIIKSANDKATGQNIDSISTIENLKQFIASDEANKKLVDATNNMIASEVELARAKTALTKQQTARTAKVNIERAERANEMVDKVGKELQQATANFFTKSAEVTTPPTQQFITKLRQIIHCGNKVLKKIPTEHTCEQINLCFLNSHTLMTSLPLPDSPDGSGLVIRLMSDILKEFITDTDVNTKELLTTINSFMDSTVLADSTMDSVNTEIKDQPLITSIYENILVNFGNTIRTTLIGIQPKGLKGLILRVDETPYPKDLTIQGYEEYGKDMKGTQIVTRNMKAFAENFKKAVESYKETMAQMKQLSIHKKDLFIRKKDLFITEKYLREQINALTGESTIPASLIAEIDKNKAEITQIEAEITQNEKNIYTLFPKINMCKQELKNLRDSLTLMIDVTTTEEVEMSPVALEGSTGEAEFSQVEHEWLTGDPSSSTKEVEMPPAPLEMPPAPLERPPAPVEMPPAPVERPPSNPVDVDMYGGKKKSYKKKIKTKNYKKSRKAKKTRTMRRNQQKSRKYKKSKKSRKVRKARKSRKVRKYKV
jgi:hypothetical protein